MIGNSLSRLQMRLLKNCWKDYPMTKKYSWYKADQRRKEIARNKREKADRYVDEMNKRANDQPITSSVR
jgi:chlorite dismutase